MLYWVFRNHKIQVPKAEGRIEFVSPKTLASRFGSGGTYAQLPLGKIWIYSILKTSPSEWRNIKTSGCDGAAYWWGAGAVTFNWDSKYHRQSQKLWPSWPNCWQRRKKLAWELSQTHSLYWWAGTIVYWILEGYIRLCSSTLRDRLPHWAWEKKPQSGI